MSQENKVPEKKSFIRQRCAPVGFRKIKFPKKRGLFANAVRPCLRKMKLRNKRLCSKKKSVGEKKSFIHQRCAPVGFRKKKCRKKRLYSPTLRARGFQESKVKEEKSFICQRCAPVGFRNMNFPKKTNIFANAARPCLRKIQFRKKRALFANAVRPWVLGK